MVAVTILPIGDSITSNGAYRLALQDRLAQAGIGCTMVGDLEDAVGRHAGHSGFTIEQVTEVARQSHDSDIVLVLAGT